MLGDIHFHKIKLQVTQGMSALFSVRMDKSPANQNFLIYF